MATRPAPEPRRHSNARLQSAGEPYPGIAAMDRVQAILRNPAVYHLAGTIPQARSTTGRPRDYPPFMHLVFADPLVDWHRAS
jgi:hypothetical protein